MTRCGSGHGGEIAGGYNGRRGLPFDRMDSLKCTEKGRQKDVLPVNETVKFTDYVS